LLTGGKFKEAAHALAKARDLDPKNTKIRAAQEQAEQYWTAAVLKRSGHNQMERGDYDAAVKSFAKAMTLNSLDQELASFHEEASAVASHSQEVLSSYALILMRAWFKALRAEVVASKKRADQEEAALQTAQEAAETARLEAEERANAEQFTAATNIQSLFRGYLGRRQTAQLRARAMNAAFKAAKAAERRAKNAEMQQEKLKAAKKKKTTKKARKQRTGNEDEERRMAAHQFEGTVGVFVEGVPKVDFNTVYLPDGAVDGWPRWSSVDGKVLFRCVGDREWHLSAKGSTTAVAYCETDGEIPVADEWMCWNKGAWSSFPVAVSALYTHVSQLWVA
jgi:hypothetical protein